MKHRVLCLISSVLVGLLGGCAVFQPVSRMSATVQSADQHMTLQYTASWSDSSATAGEGWRMNLQIAGHTLQIRRMGNAFVLGDPETLWSLRVREMTVDKRPPVSGLSPFVPTLLFDTARALIDASPTELSGAPEQVLILRRKLNEEAELNVGAKAEPDFVLQGTLLLAR